MRTDHIPIINDFEQGNIDILVGTQMVSKGLDFDNVTLVGIFDVDRMLHFPDFRSAERTYQLSVQVSGRSGRSEKPGEVVIQTANVKQPMLHYISQQNFLDFYNHEIEERFKYKYPPFYRLIRIMLKHKDKTTVNQASHSLANGNRKELMFVNEMGIECRTIDHCFLGDVAHRDFM